MEEVEKDIIIMKLKYLLKNKKIVLNQIGVIIKK